MNFIKKTQMMFKRTGTDKTIYACTIFLALFGIVMIGDASVGMSASEGSNFATKNLLKQCLFVIVGLGFMFLFARAYKTRRISETLMLVTYGVCILMMLTCIMWTINNSHAWIKIGPFTIQPVEFMKLTLIILLSYIFGVLPDQIRISPCLSKEKRNKLIWRKAVVCVFFPAFLVIFAFLICWKVQKDMGSGLILFIMATCLFFATPSQYYRPFKIIGLVGVLFLVLIFILFHNFFLKSHQMARISSWLNPLKDIYGTNYQIINGFVGYTNGGLIGRGFGNSIMKFGYIPEAQSDFISSIIVEELGLPLFVKPNQSGSSLGISKVKAKSELAAAIEFAFKEDDEILIESFLNGMEVSVGVIDYKGETIVLGITEIVPHKEFFDYEAKYEGASQEITPARIDEETTKKVEEISIKAYKSLGMSGFSRSEFIIVDGIPYLLEMNTNPGFSPASILPQQAKIYGISIKDLCGSEVEKALKK